MPPGMPGTHPGNIWSAGDEMSCIPQSLSKCYQIACKTDAYGRYGGNQRLRYKQDTNTVKERVIVLTVVRDSDSEDCYILVVLFLVFNFFSVH